MPKKPRVDTEEVRAFLRRLPDKDVYRLLDRAVDLLPATRLPKLLDDCMDGIIFFADEGGSWQVGVDWRAVLPAYFQSLAATSEPKEFAEHSINTIEDFAEYKRNRHLRDARRHASPAQKKALKELT